LLGVRGGTTLSCPPWRHLHGAGAVQRPDDSVDGVRRPRGRRKAIRWSWRARSDSRAGSPLLLFEDGSCGGGQWSRP
jgi:hypothetical protein